MTCHSEQSTAEQSEKKGTSTAESSAFALRVRVCVRAAFRYNIATSLPEVAFPARTLMDQPANSSTARIDEDLVGATVGRYVISSRLGAGAVGEVYLARHTQLRHYVAIKRLASKLRSDAQFRQRFLREGQRAGLRAQPCPYCSRLRRLGGKR